MERMVNAATSDSDAAKNAKQRYPLGTPVCERFAFGWYTGEVTGFEDGMYEVTCAALAEREVAAAPRSPAAGGGSKEQDRRGKAAFGPVRFHRRRGGGRSDSIAAAEEGGHTSGHAGAGVTQEPPPRTRSTPLPSSHRPAVSADQPASQSTSGSIRTRTIFTPESLQRVSDRAGRRDARGAAPGPSG